MKLYKVFVDRELMPLVPNFIKSRWDDLKEMRRSLHSSNMEELKRKGHLLQGTPGCFGFYYMVELGKQIESAATSGDHNNLQELLDKFELFLNNHVVVERAPPSKSA